MEALEPRLRGPEHRALWAMAVLVGPAGGHAGEELDALLDRVDGIDVKPPGLDRVHDIAPEHQRFTVHRRDQHALLSREALGSADIEEGLDLLVQAAHGLDAALLIHAP